MSDRRLLPAQLGGGECTLLDGGDGTMAAVDVPGLGAMSLPRAWLEPVPAPEPRVRSVAVDRDGDLWVHKLAGWSCVTAHAVGELSWRMLVADVGPMTPLVREPDVEWLIGEIWNWPSYALDSKDNVRLWATALLDAMRSRT